MLLFGRSISNSYLLYHGLWKVIDWLYPPHCGGCGIFGERWCNECRTSTLPLTESICPLCGIPQSDRNLCKSCAITPPPYTLLRSYTLYQGSIRHAIIQLKYRNNMGIAEILANYLLTLYNNLKINVDMITSVPISQQRKRQRGYNQAALIAFVLSLAIKVPFRPKALIRIRDTASQVNLSAIERKHNVEGAFRGDTHIVKGKVILVIDDVITTGATIEACSRALIDAGAKNVYAATVARAGLGKDSMDYNNQN